MDVEPNQELEQPVVVDTHENADSLAPSSLDDQPAEGSHATQAPSLEPSTTASISRGDIKSKLYEILQTVDVHEATERQLRQMLSDALQADMKPHKVFIRKHCYHVIIHMQKPGASMDDLQPLDDEEEEGLGGGDGDGVRGEEVGEVGVKRRKIQGKKRKGEEEDGDWDEESDRRKKKTSSKSSGKKRDAFIEDDDDQPRPGEEEEGEEGEHGEGDKAKRPLKQKAPRESKAKRKAKSKAEVAVDAMDQPGGLGEYDPRRSEAELLRRQDARQDIKAAHKACIHASSGSLGPLMELLEAANTSQTGADSRTYLIEAISQGSREVLGYISASSALLLILNSWTIEAIDEAGRGTSGPWLLNEHQGLLNVIIALLAKMPLPSLRAQQEAMRGSGLLISLRRFLTESKPSAVSEQAALVLKRYEVKSQPSNTLASSSLTSPPSDPRPLKQQQQANSFLPSFLQPMPISAVKASVHSSLPSSAAPQSNQGTRVAAVAAPAAGTALSELERKKKAAEELARAKRREEKSRALKSKSLPKIASFEDYQKKNPKKKPAFSNGYPPSSAPNGQNPSPASTSSGHAAGSSGGSAQGKGVKGAAVITASEDELGVIASFVKKNLVRHVESGAISKQDYHGIKEKVVKKVHEGNKSKGWIINDEFFSTKTERGKEQATKVLKLIEGYLAAAGQRQGKKDNRS